MSVRKYVRAYAVVTDGGQVHRFRNIREAQRFADQQSRYWGAADVQTVRVDRRAGK